jgi:hypothetical protein
MQVSVMQVAYTSFSPFFNLHIFLFFQVFRVKYDTDLKTKNDHYTQYQPLQ